MNNLFGSFQHLSQILHYQSINLKCFRIIIFFLSFFFLLMQITLSSCVYLSLISHFVKLKTLSATFSFKSGKLWYHLKLKVFVQWLHRNTPVRIIYWHLRTINLISYDEELHRKILMNEWTSNNYNYTKFVYLLQQFLLW